MRGFRLGLLLAALPGIALAAGATTSGLPGVTPSTQYSILGPRALTSMDTGLTNGRNPQTVGVEAFRIAAFSMEMISNQAISMAGAAALSTPGGMVTTEALTTAVGGTYTLVITNTLAVVGGPVPLVSVHSKNNSGGAAAGSAPGIQLQSVVLGAGTITVTIVNNGSTPLNGSLLVAFHI